MNWTSQLSATNKRLTDAFLPKFPAGVCAMQTKEGMLLFRGRVPHGGEGTHVAVTLTPELLAALAGATSAQYEEWIGDVVESLGPRIFIQYDPNNIGFDALSETGDVNLIWTEG